MASLLERSSVASSLSSRFLGLSVSAQSSASIERVKVPVTRCSVGASLPTNSSPKKSRNRDRARSPVSRTDSVNSSLACPLFRDTAQPNLPPSSRLDIPRAVTISEAPASTDSRWSFLFEDVESPVQRSTPIEASPVTRTTSSTSTSSPISEWLSADFEEPLSWQRTMLESHWLLDSPETGRPQPLDEPEGVRQIKGTTRRNRIRRKHVFPTDEPNTNSSPDIPKVESSSSPSLPSPPLVVRSSLSARERRRISRTRSNLQDSSELQVSGNMSKLNLQVVSGVKSRQRPAVPPSEESVNDLSDESVSLESSDVAAPDAAEEKGSGVTSALVNKAPDDVSTNHVWSFMRDIGYAKLLTKEEEVVLSTAFRAGEKLKKRRAELEEKEGREVTYAEWASHVGMSVQGLRGRVSVGERARERLIAANMRLVVSVVKKYTRPGVSVSDLVTAGTVGLARGVDRFDPTKGFKLSTYVHWWIRQAVTRAAAQHVGAYHLPMHVHETLAKLKRVKAELASKGMAPTSENIANFLGISKKRINKVQRLKLNARSLDDAVPCPGGFSEGSSFHNFVYDQEEDLRSWNSIETMLLKKDLADMMLSRLNVRERDIISMHYGLWSKDGNGITLDNISSRYGVSRERVRQVEMVAIRKLKSMCADKDLKRYCF